MLICFPCGSVWPSNDCAHACKYSCTIDSPCNDSIPGPADHLKLCLCGLQPCMIWTQSSEPFLDLPRSHDCWSHCTTGGRCQCNPCSSSRQAQPFQTLHVCICNPNCACWCAACTFIKLLSLQIVHTCEAVHLFARVESLMALHVLAFWLFVKLCLCLCPSPAVSHSYHA